MILTYKLALSTHIKAPEIKICCPLNIMFTTFFTKANIYPFEINDLKFTGAWINIAPRYRFPTDILASSPLEQSLSGSWQCKT